MKRAAVLFQASVNAVVLAASLAGGPRALAQYTPYQPYQPYHYQTYQPPAYHPYQPPAYQPYQPYNSRSQSSQPYQPYHYQPYQPYHDQSSQPSQPNQPYHYEPYHSEPYHYEPYHSSSSNENESGDTSQHSDSTTWSPHHFSQPPTAPLVPHYHSFVMDPPYAPNSPPQYHYEHSAITGHDEIIGPNGPVWHEGLNPTVPDPYQGKKPSFTDKYPGFPVDPKEEEKVHEEHNEAPPWL